jgi:putative glutathione S-transferase
VNMDQIKRHYYMSHRQLNPSGIVPKGPVPEFLGEETRPARAS